MRSTFLSAQQGLHPERDPFVDDSRGINNLVAPSKIRNFSVDWKAAAQLLRSIWAG